LSSSYLFLVPLGISIRTSNSTVSPASLRHYRLVSRRALLNDPQARRRGGAQAQFRAAIVRARYGLAGSVGSAGIPAKEQDAREQGWLQEWAKTGAAARCRRGSARARLRNRRPVRRRGPHPTTASRANPTLRADPVVHAQATGRTDPTRPADPAAAAKATGRTDPTGWADPVTQAEATRGADPPLAPHPAAPAQPTTRTDPARVKATRRVDPTQAAGAQASRRADWSARAKAARRTDLPVGAVPVPLAQTDRDDLTQRTGPMAEAQATRRRSDSCRHRRARHHCRCCAASLQGRDPARADLFRQHHRARQLTGQRRLARTDCPFRLGCQGVRRALRSARSPPLRDLRCLPAGLRAGPVLGRCRRASRSGSPGSGETARSGRSRCLPPWSGCSPVPWSLGCC
jgi:hypothetical protein